MNCLLGILWILRPSVEVVDRPPIFGLVPPIWTPLREKGLVSAKMLVRRIFRHVDSFSEKGKNRPCALLQDEKLPIISEHADMTAISLEQMGSVLDQSLEDLLKPA